MALWAPEARTPSSDVGSGGMAERPGFEPGVPVKVRWLSKGEGCHITVSSSTSCVDFVGTRSPMRAPPKFPLSRRHFSVTPIGHEAVPTSVLPRGPEPGDDEEEGCLLNLHPRGKAEAPGRAEGPVLRELATRPATRSSVECQRLGGPSEGPRPAKVHGVVQQGRKRFGSWDGALQAGRPRSAWHPAQWGLDARGRRGRDPATGCGEQIASPEGRFRRGRATREDGHPALLVLLGASPCRGRIRSDLGPWPYGGYGPAASRAQVSG